MKKWSAEAKVGIFTLLGIILFAVLIVQLSHSVLFGKSGFYITGYFNEAEGLKAGDKIHYAGVDVGVVEKISVEKGKAVLHIKLYNGVEIPEDADFSIETNSVMGSRFVKVFGGHAEKGYLSDGMIVVGKATPGIDATIQKMDKLIDTTQTMVEGINTIVADTKVQNEVKNSIGNIESVSKNLHTLTLQGMQIANQAQNVTEKMDNMLDELNGDGKLTKDVRNVMNNLVVASDSAKQIAGDAQKLSKRFNGIISGDDMSLSGEILYNTKDNTFSPNLFVESDGDRFVKIGIESLGNSQVMDAIAGNKNGNFSFYGGIIRGKLGIGTAYTKDKWKFLFDAYDLDKITLRARGQYKFYPNLYGIGQFIWPEDRIGGGTYVGLSYTY